MFSAYEVGCTLFSPLQPSTYLFSLQPVLIRLFALVNQGFPDGQIQITDQMSEHLANTGMIVSF